MIVLDEQMRADQRTLLARWGIRFRQIGREIAPSGIQDENIIPLLLTLNRPTFFTHDQGFFDRRRSHSRCCLVWLDVSDIQAAEYIRRLLRHPDFDTRAKRMGSILRVHPSGIHLWHIGQSKLARLKWQKS